MPRPWPPPRIVTMSLAMTSMTRMRPSISVLPIRKKNYFAMMSCPKDGIGNVQFVITS